MQNKPQEVMSFLQFEIIDGRVICLYRCSTGPAQALGCDRYTRTFFATYEKVSYMGTFPL